MLSPLPEETISDVKPLPDEPFIKEHPELPGLYCSQSGEVYKVAEDGKLIAVKHYFHPSGYLRFCHDGKERLFQHVIARTFLGPCPEGMWVLHRQDVKADNRPGISLYYGSPRQNTLDAHRNGRNSVCIPGSNHSSAKLDEETVETIRIRYAFTPLSQRRIAADYGIKKETVRAILSGKTWKYLPPTVTSSKPKPMERKPRAMTDEQRRIAEFFNGTF